MNKIQEIKELSEYLRGASSVAHNPGNAETLFAASMWLRKLSKHICGHGIIGCNGGENCTSSHK
jgi:hypothetical protein